MTILLSGAIGFLGTQLPMDFIYRIYRIFIKDINHWKSNGLKNLKRK